MFQLLIALLAGSPHQIERLGQLSQLVVAGDRDVFCEATFRKILCCLRKNRNRLCDSIGSAVRHKVCGQSHEHHEQDCHNYRGAADSGRILGIGTHESILAVRHHRQLFDGFPCPWNGFGGEPVLGMIPIWALADRDGLLGQRLKVRKLVIHPIQHFLLLRCQ